MRNYAAFYGWSFITESEIKLEKNMSFYLRLFAHGYEDKEISDFLEITKKEVNELKISIEKKYNMSCWLSIIRIAFKTNALIKNDYVEDNIVKNAHLFAEEIFSDFMISKEDITKNRSLLDVILNFYNTCLDCSDIAFVNLNEDEKEFLIFKYENSANLNNFEKTKIKYTKEDEICLNTTIQIKLLVSNCFNAIRKAFRLKIIDKDNYITININIEARRVSNEINRIKGLKKPTINEKRFKIFQQLVDFYNMVEYNYLLHEDMSEKLIRLKT